MSDSLLPLITNLATKNRDYVIFVGAGFSKDAGVKSGWDILIETLIPLYVNENNLSELPTDHYSKVEDWYLKHNEYSKLGYSEILELLYKGEIERREYLKKFFVNAQLGEAHRQLALMVANRLVRFIFTTNFDDLIEKALDEMNLDYDVIYSDDILRSTKSWDKVQTCRIYKLHGDYKTGKVRNTVSELQKLELLISDDFQYIIDRHGLIVIGYSGRDRGVMDHFLDRKPYSYPFYWQYRSHPEDRKSYELYHELMNKYENKYNRRINYVQNESASAFLSAINSGIEKLDRIVIASQDGKHDYRDYIVEKNEKKIRALTIELYNRFASLYDEYISKEDKDRFYVYKFEVFEEFVRKIECIFYYLNDLLTYDKNIDEAKYFADKIIKRVTDMDLRYSCEFIRVSTPYYVMMVFGALYLRNNRSELIASFYEYRIKYGSGYYENLISLLSFEQGGWATIDKEKYKRNYYVPRFSIIQEKLLPPIITSQDFNLIDAYITLDLVIHKRDYYWRGASSMFRDDFQNTFFKYFGSEIDNREKAIEFYKNLYKKYSTYYNTRDGIDMVLSELKRQFSIQDEELKS